MGIKSRLSQSQNCGRFFSPDLYAETEGNIRIGSAPSPNIIDHPRSGPHVFATAIRPGLDTGSLLIIRT
jgi:hypothetical protein